MTVIDLNQWHPTIEDRARFWSKVDVRGPDECWPWIAALAGGYGVFVVHIGGQRRNARAHRVAWVLTGRRDPGKLDLDHTCHNADATCKGGSTCIHRRCVNPAHLRRTSRSTNLRAGRGHGSETHCPAGHEYTTKNTQITKRNQRICRRCRNLRCYAIRRAKRKAMKDASL